MAGIKANSATVTMGDVDTAADKAVGGYVTGETITLSTTPTGSSYSWGIAKPSDATSRSNLSATSGGSVTFTPDAAGYYVVTVTVDSTTSYVIRVSVTQIAQATTVESLRLSPKADADVPTPALGAALYWSSTQSALAIKDSSGTVFTVDVTAA